jgi:hypothetical protein
LINALNPGHLAGQAGTSVQPGGRLFTAKLCFLLDCTGSMGKEIASAKEKLTSIMSACREKFGTKIEVSVAFIGYRDVEGEFNNAGVPPCIPYVGGTNVVGPRQSW